MASFMEDLWSSIFTAGPTPTLLLATNVTFAVLQILLLVLLLATYSIHFVILSILSGSLWYSINWFAQELKQTQAEARRQGSPSETAPGEATQTDVKARSPETPDGAESDTETESLVDRKSARAPGSAPQSLTASTTLEVPGSASEVRKRLSVSGESSGYTSTDSEWEKVDDSNEK
ncbi:ER protein Pkr1-domain-containing protein [Aspergillus karnatakaensis]|uniref:V-type ATPase assembly factor PKR1 n=1 Tax=Aspergillus karnatakaensis TaxID=1810916 RepID=UPI003CCD979E